MRDLGRVVGAFLIALATPGVFAAEPLRPHLAIQFGEEVGHAGESIGVEVAVLDGSGKPVDAPVAIDVDAGKITAPQKTAPGVYRASITIPTSLPGSRSILVLARSGILSAEASIRLAPGPAATLRLDGPRECPEDAEACRIDVIAADGYGNPAAEIPDATAEMGSVSSAGAADPGHWVVIYHPPRVDREREEKITVEVGKQRAVHVLRLSPARTRIGFAPLVGAVRQQGHLGLSFGGQVLGERLLSSGWLLGAGLEGSWWRISRTGEISGLHTSTDRSQLAVGLFVQAERSIGGPATVAFSAGGGAVRVNSTAHVEGQPGVTDIGWAPTARATALLGYRFPFGMPFVEARAAWVGDAHLVTDPGAQWPLSLHLGYRLDVR